MGSTPQQSASQANRPVEEILLGGVKAAIWRNETESGVRYNVTFERIYRDGKEWRSTNSFGRDDLLLLAKAADQAHTWIIEADREAKSAERKQPEGKGESPRLENASITRRK